VGKKISKVKQDTSIISINSLSSDSYYGATNEEIISHYFLIYGAFPNSISKDFKIDLNKIYLNNKEKAISVHYCDETIHDMLLQDEENKALIHFNSNGNPMDLKIKMLICYPNNKSIGVMKKYISDMTDPYLVADDDTESKVYFILHNGGGYDLQDYMFNKPIINIELNYGDNFIETHNKIVEIIKAKKSGLILFHSLPGTGKSKYIQYLTDVISEKKFIYLNSELFSAFDSPQFTSFALSELKDTVLILEDCENIITSREINKYNHVISTLLNLTSGIFADVLNCKIICTFNTATDNIDAALLRKGRLLIEHEFRKLTTEEANTLFKHIHKTDKDQFTSEVTLSEVYNIEEVKSVFKKERRKIGF
jgi:hypothetical protein